MLRSRALLSAVVVAVLAACAATPEPVPEPSPAPVRSLVAADVGLLDLARDEPAPEPEPTVRPAPRPSFPPGSTVVGAGTPASCTSDALAEAVRYGGHVVFDCGPAPVIIEVTRTLHTCNTTTCDHLWKGGNPVETLTVDGGGLVTLSGAGRRGIYYANACEESLGWLGERCQDETRPHVTFTDITFTDGNAQGPPDGFDGLGPGAGGAILMRAGRLTLDGVTFRDNRCVTADSDAGGGAVRVVGMPAGATITRSVFEDNACANGGAISALHAPLTIVDSRIIGNTATGSGASSGDGGNGGGVYFDGTSQDVVIRGTEIRGNVAPEGGPAVFYVSNDHTGTLTIEASELTGNSGQRFHTAPYRSIYYLGSGEIRVSGSTVE